MDLATIITGVVLLALCIVPIVVMARKGRDNDDNRSEK